MSPRSLATGLGLLLGGGALVLQFWLSMSARLGQGHDLLNALLWFFTYFTILTNLMLVLIYLSALSSTRWLGWWRSPVTRGMMAAAMTLVMGFYHFVLAATWQPQGLFHLADVLLHYATPLVYLGWWLAFQAKGRLRLSDIGWMLLPPLGWLAWTMARGAVVNEYPYPVLEVARLGFPQVFANITGLLVVLLVLFALVVLIDRALGSRQNTSAAE